MNKLLLSLVAVAALFGCQPKENVEAERLLAKVDSLQSALEISNYSASLLGQIGSYMDSIDSNRKWVELNLETGLSQDDYVTRMKRINQYVQKAEWTISELEKTRSAYAKQVTRLKKEIAEKDAQITSLQVTVAQTQAKNKELEETLKLTETELVMSQLEQDITEEELAKSNTMAQSLMQKVELTRAESLYSQGEGFEQLAGAIQLAPKRKKQALEDALKHYTASKDLGYAPAAAKVESIKVKLAK